MTHTTKHTPGPWTADECSDAQGFFTIRPSDGKANGDTEQEPIATVYNDKHINLIAAAPAMYEALQGCLRVAQAYLHDTLARWEDYEGKVPSGIAELDAAHMEVARIRAALSQAEGKQ